MLVALRSAIEGIECRGGGSKRGERKEERRTTGPCSQGQTDRQAKHLAFRLVPPITCYYLLCPEQNRQPMID